ncbi:hypothetical protein C7B76_19130 [filamentous cyanobacterium CCP2]|nr:hypothetical protein C7B76_19130 [filamentous cyanobacterium CCP2]
MNITESTKLLNRHVQMLKAKYPDLVSTVFIDFYCQCQEGIDYLFPVAVQKSIRLLDIVQWFFACVDDGTPTTLINLMWQDVMGPTLGEYLQDEKSEMLLRKAFTSNELKAQIKTWDRVQMPDGNMNLVMKGLLEEISQLEQEHRMNDV